MGSKIKTIAIVVGVLTVGGSTLSWAGSGGTTDAASVRGFELYHQATASGEGSTNTLRVRGKEVDSAFLDLGDADFGIGDQLAFTNDLLRDGAKIGEDGGLCVVTRVTGTGHSTFKCVGSNYLPGGQITVQGLVTYGPNEEFKEDPYLFAITGGTGRYRTARGDVRIVELGNGRLRITFRIIT